MRRRTPHTPRTWWDEGFADGLLDSSAAALLAASPRPPWRLVDRLANRSFLVERVLDAVRPGWDAWQWREVGYRAGLLAGHEGPAPRRAA